MKAVAAVMLALLGAASCRVLLQNDHPIPYPGEHPVDGNWQDTCVLKDRAGAVKSTTYGTCYDCVKAGLATGAYAMEWYGGSWSDISKYDWRTICTPAAKPTPAANNAAIAQQQQAAAIEAYNEQLKLNAAKYARANTNGANTVPDAYPDEHPVAGNWQDTCVLKDQAGAVKSTTYGTCYDCAKAGLATGAYTMQWHGGSWSNIGAYAWDVVCGDWENQANRG